jgi:hypothetical protein
VDRTLKETPEDAGEGLAELAESLLREMQGGVANKLSGWKDDARRTDSISHSLFQSICCPLSTQPLSEAIAKHLKLDYFKN